MVAPADYSPYAEAVFDDPYPLYKALRDDDPAHYDEELDAHFLTRFDDIWALGTNSKNLSVKDGTTPDHLLVRKAGRSLSISNMDPPRHGRHRSAIAPQFRPSAAAEMESTLRAFAAQRAQEMVEQGSGDLLRDYAGQIAVRGALLTAGFPIEIAEQALEWVNGIFHRAPDHRGMTSQGTQAGIAIFEYCTAYVKEMSKQPDKATGVLHVLLNQEIDGKRLTEPAIASFLSEILVGGSDTLPKALGATLQRLSQNPDQRAQVVADPGLIPDAFLEALRIDTPTQMLGRRCIREFELHGRTIAPDSAVMFCWAAANRDDREFPEPDRYDLTRRPRRMLAFGHGLHMCIGHHIAKAEAKLALEELLKRAPDYELHLDRAVRLRTDFVQGWLELPATLSP